MKIKEYISEYTAGNRIHFKHILWEIGELLIELFKFNKSGIIEELSDVFHFLQLWLYWRFGIKGETWSITEKTVTKCISRKKVWQKIYLFVGLDKNISGYAGNYNKIDKVISHLSKFGISKERAEDAYNAVIVRKQENRF